MAQQLMISHGPEKMDLMHALFDKKVVEFTFNGQVVRVRINGLECEGDRGCWFVRGSIVSSNQPIHWFYNTNLRTGREL